MAKDYGPGRFLRLDDGRVVWWYQDQLLPLKGTSWVPPDRPVPLRLLRESRRLTLEELKHLEDSVMVLPKSHPSFVLILTPPPRPPFRAPTLLHSPPTCAIV